MLLNGQAYPANKNEWLHTITLGINAMAHPSHERHLLFVCIETNGLLCFPFFFEIFSGIGRVAGGWSVGQVQHCSLSAWPPGSGPADGRRPLHRAPQRPTQVNSFLCPLLNSPTLITSSQCDAGRAPPGAPKCWSTKRVEWSTSTLCRDPILSYRCDAMRSYPRWFSANPTNQWKKMANRRTTNQSAKPLDGGCKEMLLSRSLT